METKKILDISLQALTRENISIIVESFNAIGWNKPAALFEQYCCEQETGERVVWLAFTGEYFAQETFAGYITLKWQSSYQSFMDQNIPEIMDLNVLPAYRKNGIGSMLLDIAEGEAKKRVNVIGIGVGLYAGEDGGYGSAQRMYVKRGYVPDGKGITYNGQPVLWGKNYPIDDDLVLWFTKNLE